MSLFKYKPNKVKYLTNVVTLDEMHKKKTNEIMNEKQSLDGLKEKLDKTKNELEDLEKKRDPQDIGRKAELKELIDDLKENIYDIENNVRELDYYSKTNDVVMEYYRDSDSKTVIQPNEIKSMDRLTQLNMLSQQNRKTKKETKKRMRTLIQKPTIDILSYLTGGKSSATEIVKPSNSNKASLYEEYLSRIDNSYNTKKKLNIIKMCEECDIEKILMQSEGMYVCPNCAEIEYVIIESEVPNHKEPSSDKTRYPYKRLNHLIEWLNQFQAKESTEIPEEIYDDIKNHLRRLRLDIKIKSMKFFKAKKVIKEILQKLRKTIYYEHIPYIISKITGNPPIVLSREVEERIKQMFKQMQEPFVKYCPQDRVNFLNYSYILHKIFVIFEMHEMAKCFGLLKSSEKLRLQDSIWKKICVDLKWPYVASI